MVGLSPAPTNVQILQFSSGGQLLAQLFHILGAGAHLFTPSEEFSSDAARLAWFLNHPLLSNGISVYS